MVLLNSKNVIDTNSSSKNDTEQTTQEEIDNLPKALTISLNLYA